MPLQLDDVSGFPRLFAVLVQRGWSDEDLGKLAGKNMLRVMREVETVAHNLQQETPPSNVSIAELDKSQ